MYTNFLSGSRNGKEHLGDICVDENNIKTNIVHVDYEVVGFIQADKITVNWRVRVKIILNPSFL
jgi:hypothetical protein